MSKSQEQFKNMIETYSWNVAMDKLAELAHQMSLEDARNKELWQRIARRLEESRDIAEEIFSR